MQVWVQGFRVEWTLRKEGRKDGRKYDRCIGGLFQEWTLNFGLGTLATFVRFVLTAPHAAAASGGGTNEQAPHAAAAGLSGQRLWFGNIRRFK
jgi:hypothetical protein